MNFLRALVSVVLIAAFALIFSLSLWAYTITDWTLRSEATTLQGRSQHPAVYDSLSRSVYVTLFEHVWEGATVGSPEWYTRELITAASPTAQQAAAQVILSEEWLTQQTDYIGSAILSWLQTPTAVPDVRVETGPIEARLQGQAGAEMAAVLYQSLPACTAGQQTAVEQIQSDQAGDAAALPDCAPESITQNDFAAYAQQSTITTAFPSQQFSAQTLLYIKSFLRSVSALSIGVFAFPAVLIGGVWAVSVRSLKGFLGWVGLASFVGGLTALLLPLALIVRGAGALTLLPAFSDTELYVAYFVGAISPYITQPMLIQAGVMAGVGFIFIIGSRIIK